MGKKHFWDLISLTLKWRYWYGQCLPRSTVEHSKWENIRKLLAACLKTLAQQIFCADREKGSRLQTLNARLLPFCSVATPNLAHVFSSSPVPGISQTEGLTGATDEGLLLSMRWATELLNILLQLNEGNHISCFPWWINGHGIPVDVPFICCREPCIIDHLNMWLYFCWIIKLEVLSVPET